jgi:hypothetical protein
MKKDIGSVAAVIWDYTDFIAWLRKLYDQPAGNPYKPETCPIAQWLVSKGFAGVKVMEDEVWFNGQRLSLPVWAQEFVHGTDITRGERQKEVTGREALEKMQEARERMDQARANEIAEEWGDI